MRKNDDRKTAEEAFLKDRGRITNKELANKLDVHPATVARWRKLDEWDLKLIQSVSAKHEPPPSHDDDHYGGDLRHIAILNDRIEVYLKKKELLPSEILDLAEAKYHLMSCKAIVEERLQYPPEYGIDDDQEGFD